MLENLRKPVIFTGSLITLLVTYAQMQSDYNIQIASLLKDGQPVVAEVCLYFEYKLYQLSTKINAEHFKAFTSPNYPELVESGVHLRSIRTISSFTYR
jgi:L-asparaginase